MWQQQSRKKTSQWHSVVSGLVSRTLRVWLLAIVVTMVCSCRTPQQAWNEAHQENTEVALTTFMQEYPKSEHVPAARAQVEALRWDQAKKAHTVGSYEKFLTAYPKSANRGQAQHAIDEIRWNLAKEKDDAQTVKRFLHSYPDSSYRGEALRLLEELEWRQSLEQRTVEALQEFLSDYPASSHSNEARELMVDIAWEQAVRANNRSYYAQFLEKHPNGKHSLEAKKRIEEADWRQFEEAPTVFTYRQYVKRHPQSSRLEENRAEIERQVWNNISGSSDRPAFVDFLQEFPASDWAREATRELEELDWRHAMSGGTIAGYEAFLSAHPESRHGEEAISALERLSWERTKAQGTQLALKKFLRQFPSSEHAREAEALVKSDRDRWNIELHRYGRAAMEMEDWTASGWSIGYGGYILAEYLEKGKRTVDNGLAVTTYVWPPEAFNRTSHNTDWNDLVLAVQDKGQVIYSQPFGFLVEIERREILGTDLIDLACAEVLLSDGTRVRPCGLFLADIDARVTGRLQGCLFKGYIRLGGQRYKAVQGGPPYPGNVKLSLPQNKVDSLFEFRPGGRVTLGLLFQKVDENNIKELTVLGRKVPFPPTK